VKREAQVASAGSRLAARRKEIASGGELELCPYCASTRTERTAAFGPFHMTEPYVCLECHSPFSRIRWRDARHGPSERVAAGSLEPRAEKD
jgi:hypothetical protein